jgi:hypothetical protein
MHFRPLSLDGRCDESTVWDEVCQREMKTTPISGEMIRAKAIVQIRLTAISVLADRTGNCHDGCHYYRHT